MKITAEKLYKLLLKEKDLLTFQNIIQLNNGKTIIMDTKDNIGNIIQRIVQEFMDDNNIEYDTEENTQLPPDFYLDKPNDCLEIKAFNYDARAGFDVANFETYINEIIQKPYLLYSKYMVFGYRMINKEIVIQNIWLKNVWELCCAMTEKPLNCQYKRKVVYIIRPHSFKNGKFPPFACIEDFISAVYETIQINFPSKYPNWKNDFKKAYESYFKKCIYIPNWHDIKHKYN